MNTNRFICDGHEYHFNGEWLKNNYGSPVARLDEELSVDRVSILLVEGEEIARWYSSDLYGNRVRAIQAYVSYARSHDTVEAHS